MPSPQDLKDNISEYLREKGYKVSNYVNSNYCFDIVARKNDKILIIKHLKDLTKLNIKIARELKAISIITDAVPLVIASKDSKKIKLFDEIVYRKYNIFSMNLKTFKIVISRDGGYFVYAERGGFHVSIDGEKLRRIRESRGLSLGAVAEIAGVSRKTIYEYERGNIESTPQIISRLEEALGESLIKPQNIFSWKESIKLKKDKIMKSKSFKNEVERKVCKELHKIGFEALPLSRAPFEIIAKREDSLIIKMLTQRRKINSREIDYSKNFAKATNSQMVIVTRSRGDIAKEIKDEALVVPLKEISRLRKIVN